MRKTEKERTYILQHITFDFSLLSFFCFSDDVCVCVCFLKRFFYVCWLTADAIAAATATTTTTTSSTVLYTRVYKKKKTKEQRKERELQ